MREQLAWPFSVEGSPASQSASPERDSHRPTSDGCGQSSFASRGRSNPQSSSPRTCLDCARPDCETCWPTLPLSGSMRSGRVSQPAETRGARTDGPTSERRTNDGESFSLLPTPTARPYGANRGGSAGRCGPSRASRETLARHGLLPTPVASLSVNGPTHHGDGSPTLLGAVGAKMPSRLLMTPTANTGSGGTRRQRSGGPTLIAQVGARRPSALLPTSTVKGNHNRAGLSASSGDGLATAVGGTLHPRFVEWMMGLPMDWTVPGEMTAEEIETKRASLRRKRPTPGA